MLVNAAFTTTIPNYCHYEKSLLEEVTPNLKVRISFSYHVMSTYDVNTLMGTFVNIK